MKQITFCNSDGLKQIVLLFSACDDYVLSFDVDVHHDPFTAKLKGISLWVNELKRYLIKLKQMYSMKIKEFSFYSTDRDVAVECRMDPAGHIVAQAYINSGSRGHLSFSFEFDQSFLPDMIQQVEDILSEV